MGLDADARHVDRAGSRGCAALHCSVLTSLSLQATRDQIGVSEQGQLTDRFSKAVEQLGNKDSLEVRLGGVYALERIARDSARDHPTVMEVLSAYVREHAPKAMCTNTSTSTHPTTDVQAILTVIGRRDVQRDSDVIALNDTCLSGAYLSRADLSGADLRFAYLSGADLSGADLSGADLSGAYLRSADLRSAHLDSADLSHAYLSGAYLGGADLRNADLRNAYLRSADLSRADLSGAHLDGADLDGADLSGADLRNARGLPSDSIVPAPPTTAGH